MKIISKIKIHLFFYIFMFICLITGNIYDFLLFTLIIIIHELGHIISGIIFNWEIEKIIILPMGGLTIFNTKINTSLCEQFIVAISGPLFQMIFFYIISFFYTSSNITFLNYLLLMFNLLPIYPLDGSKILSVFLNLLLPFKLCNLLIIFISIILIFSIFIYFDFNLILSLILIFLLVKNIREFYLRNYIFNKFLFERYIYSIPFKRVLKVKKLSSMRIWAKHIFFIDNSYITERKILSKRFDK